MIKILVVDNHPIVTTGLELYLQSEPTLKLLEAVSTGEEIFDFIRRHTVDIIISEIDLPELNGITALASIKKEHTN